MMPSKVIRKIVNRTKNSASVSNENKEVVKMRGILTRIPISLEKLRSILGRPFLNRGNLKIRKRERNSTIPAKSTVIDFMRDVSR